MSCMHAHALIRFAPLLLQVVLADFAALLKSHRGGGGQMPSSAVASFVKRNFFPAGDELEEVDPRSLEAGDPSSSPSSAGVVVGQAELLVAGVADPRLRSWARALHDLWSSLGRQIKSHLQHQHQHQRLGTRRTLLPRSAPMVVPGGRFRETCVIRPLSSNTPRSYACVGD